MPVSFCRVSAASENKVPESGPLVIDSHESGQKTNHRFLTTDQKPMTQPNPIPAGRINHHSTTPTFSRKEA